MTALPPADAARAEAAVADAIEPPVAVENSAAGADLGRRTARGAIVTLGGQGSQILLQMTLVVVLARLLSPSDYGLYAMILVICGIGEVFRDFGLSSAVVQARTLTRGQRDNLFWINSGIGVILGLTLFVAAPLVADMFGEPRLVPVAHVLSVTFVINGMGTQFRAGLNRAMRFGALAATDLAAQVVSVSVAISLAAAGASYWALVISQLAQVTTVLLLLVLFARWLPGPPQRKDSVADFLRFGSNFVATQLINYAANNVDSLTIGIRFGAAPLGLYNRAYQLLMNPLSQLRKPATTVALPVLSRLQDDHDRANAYVLRGQVLIGYTVVPGLALVVGAAVPIVHLFLGGRWASAAFVLSMLAIAGIFQMMSFVGYWVYLSRGLTNHLLRYTVFSFVLRIASILIGSNWGVNGVAVGFAIAPALAWPVSLWWLGRRAPIPLGSLYRGAGRVLVVSLVVGVTAAVVTRALTATHGLADISVLALTVMASVAAAAVLIAVVPVLRRDFHAVSTIATSWRRR